MSDDSKIEWTDATWNPIRGCSRVSEGCRHCYAERVAARFSGPGMPYEGLIKFGKPSSVRDPRWNGTVRMVPEHLADPLRWRRPRRVFVNSMSDLFHESLTNEQIAAVFGVMAASPRHTFQVLTKRAARMRKWFEWVTTAPQPYGGLPSYADHRHERAVCCRCAWMVPGYEADHAGAIGLHPSDDVLEHQRGPWPLPNVWIGVSVENQAEFEAGAAYDRIERAGAAITSASQAAASGNVIAGAPRDPSIAWMRCHRFPCDWAAHADGEPVGVACHPRRRSDQQPCWDATARVWRWGSPASDPRGCAWPRPWAGGEVRRG